MDYRRGLDDIWPRIGAELERARRREAAMRRMSRMALQGAGALAVAVTVLTVATFTARISRPARVEPDRTAWDLADIAAVENVSEQYPLVRGRSVFAIRERGAERQIVCVDRHSGAIRWQSGLSVRDCRLAEGDRRLYVLFRGPGAGWECAAFDSECGSELWRRPAGVKRGASPSLLTAVAGGVAWSAGNRVVLLEAADGVVRWMRTTDAPDALSAPRTRGNALFVASRRTAYAFDTELGHYLWTRVLDTRRSLGLFPGLLELHGGRLYVAGRASGGAGRISCLDADSGALRWSAPSATPLRIQVCGDEVFVRSGELSAYDARTGASLWHVALGGCGPVSFGEGRVYVVDTAERRELLAIESRSGRTAWRRRTVGSCSGVVTDEGMGFISGKDGVLRALALN